MEEYKGIYYNDDKEQQYYEGGAHFKYKELYKILEELAKKMNTHQASYSHYENATNLIPTVFLYNLTEIYKPFSIDELFGRKKQ